MLIKSNEFDLKSDMLMSTHQCTFEIGGFDFPHEFGQIPAPGRFAGRGVSLEQGRQPEQRQFAQQRQLTDRQRSHGRRSVQTEDGRRRRASETVPAHHQRSPVQSSSFHY